MSLRHHHCVHCTHADGVTTFGAVYISVVFTLGLLFFGIVIYGWWCDYKEWRKEMVKR